MLYVFGGNKTKARGKMRSTLDNLMKRAPLANVLRVTNEEAEQVSVESLLAEQGLFYAKRIAVFDNALKEKNARENIAPHLKDMARSEHIFLILEEEIDAALKKQLTAHATKADISEDGEKKEKYAPDWSAANALERKEGKKLWLALAKGFLEGVSAEQMHGQLFWKAKQMIITRRFGAWSEEKVKTLVGDLAELPHESRRRGVEMEYALERFALEI